MHSRLSHASGRHASGHAALRSCQPVCWRGRVAFRSASLSAGPQGVTSTSQPGSSSRNLVVAIDQSEGQGSYKAVQWTLKNLYRSGDVLHLLHVVPAANTFVPQAFSLAPVLPPEEGLQEQMAEHMRKLIEQHYLKLAIEYDATFAVELVHGKCNQSVSTAIVSKCEDLAASVVVLSMQKESWLDSLFQVPVTKQVADNCQPAHAHLPLRRQQLCAHALAGRPHGAMPGRAARSCMIVAVAAAATNSGGGVHPPSARYCSLLVGDAVGMSVTTGGAVNWQ